MHCTFWLLSALLLSAATAGGQPGTRAVPAARFDHYAAPGPRHWRGTIGQLAVTLDLDSGRWGFSGSYCYDRRGQPLRFSQPAAKGRKSGQIRLNESAFDNETGVSTATGYFLLDGPLRSPLTGTWHSPDGRRTLPVALHETYADALAYDSETWEVRQFSRGNDYDSTRLDSAELRQAYLHFRSPLAATRPLRAALGRPVPPPRMPRYLDSLLRARHSGQYDYFFYGDTYVAYNSNYLFSVVQFDRFMAAEDEGMGTHERSQSSTYDLRTGRRLRLADLLTPGYEVQLRRWLLQGLKPVWENAYYDGVGANGKLPTGGFLITGTGLRFAYDDRDDERLGSPGPYHADRSVEVEIPYEKLLPLIRPNGPLAALLRERHLRPAKPVP
ncbi:hypothetical protein [Hymenobacter daeguensis]